MIWMEYSHTGSSLKAIQLFLHAILYNFRGKELKVGHQ